MVDLGVEHQLEYDLACFVLSEWLQGKPGVPECPRIECVEILEVPMKAARHPRDCDIQGVEILVWVLGVHFHHERVAPARSARSHGYVLERDAFALNRLDEIHERRCAHHRHGLRHPSSTSV